MKNRVNKQIIKALSVGLAASMALQPVAVYAEEGEPVAPSSEPAESVPATGLTEAVPHDVEGGVADEAQEYATDASNPVEVVTNEAGDVVKDERGDLDKADVTVDKVTDEILNNHAEAGEDPTNAIPKEAGIVTEKGKKIDLSGEVINKAKDLDEVDIDSTKDNIENAKGALIVAEVADATENVCAQGASEIVKEIENKASTAENEVSAANTRADVLISAINNATTVEDAQSAYNELDALAKDTSDNIVKYSNEIKELQDKYADAIKALKGAQGRFTDAINNKENGAAANVAAASDEVKKANDAVQALKKAIDAAQKNINTVHEDAVAIIKAQKAVEDADELDKTEKQDDLFKTVMETYYADKLIGKNGKDPQFTQSENGYFTLEYKIKKNGKTETQTKYYDYDVNEDGDIVFYEKSEKEVKALDAIAAYEAENKVSLSDDYKNVYEYTEGSGWNKTTKYITKAEIEKRDDIQLIDGSYYVLKDGKETFKLNPITSAPGKNDIKQGETNTFDTGVQSGTESVSYEVKSNGTVVKHTTATISTATYKRDKDTPETGYKKDRYSKDDKKKAVAALGQDVTILEVKDDNKTFYVLTGTYTPTYVLTLDEKDGVYKVAPFGSENAAGYVNDDIESNSYSNNYLYSSDLNGNWEKDPNRRFDPNFLYENYLITGTVTFTQCDGKWQVVKSEVITSDEFEKDINKIGDDQYKAGLDDLMEKIEAGLSDDGFSINDIKINSKKYVGMYYVWPQYKNEEKSFTLTESYQLNDTYADEYEKFSFYIDYIKKVGTDVRQGDISTVEYENAVKAVEVLQDMLKDKTLKNLLDGEKGELAKELAETKNLLEKYNQYAQDADKAATDLANAKTDIDTLNGAISTLYSNHETKKAKVALSDLLGKQSISDFLGIKYDENGKFGKRTKEDIEGMNVNELIAFLDELKETAEQKFEDAKTKLAELEQKKDDAKKDLDQKVADLTPTGDDGDDDDDTPSYGGGDDTTPVVGPAIASNVVVTPAVAGDNAAVLGEVRKTSTKKASSKSAASTETVATDNSNGNNDNAAVAGAQKEETKTPEAPKEETKIEDSDTALAATPELEEKGFAWWWLLILAAIAGVSVEEYARRKSNKAKAEAKDSTKINK
jgi:hypothetical protein